VVAAEDEPRVRVQAPRPLDASEKS
jgi:hypothetical protein